VNLILILTIGSNDDIKPKDIIFNQDTTFLKIVYSIISIISKNKGQSDKDLIQERLILL